MSRPVAGSNSMDDAVELGLTRGMMRTTTYMINVARALGCDAEVTEARELCEAHF